MSSTNKVVTPLNSAFSADTFFSVLLRKSKPSVVFQGKETLTPDFSAGREVRTVMSGAPSAFQGEVVGLEYSGDMPQAAWYSVMDLSINLGLSEALNFCLLPQHLLVWPETCATRPDSSQDLHCERRALRSSVRHLAVNFSKHFQSLVPPGEVKEPPNVFTVFGLTLL